jgi:hypothetical protein
MWKVFAILAREGQNIKRREGQVIMRFCRFRMALLLVLGPLHLNGCMTLPVQGEYKNTGEKFLGSATGYLNGEGDISITSESGSKCQGNFRYLTRAVNGDGWFICDDGRTGNFFFISNGHEGKGIGKDEHGELFRFQFGNDVRQAGWSDLSNTFDAMNRKYGEVTPYAKSIGIKDEKEIDGVLKSYTFALALFVRGGVLTNRESEAELSLETYHLRAENKSQAYKYGYLNTLYKQYPEAQDRRRLCRGVDFGPEGYPTDLECKGVKLSSLAEASSKQDQAVGGYQANESGSLPPRLPSPPSSQRTVFGPDGKMQICNTHPNSRTVFCY